MEDHSGENAATADRSEHRRRFIRGEFLSDWLGRLRQPEAVNNSQQPQEGPANNLGRIAEHSYLISDSEPLESNPKQPIYNQERRGTPLPTSAEIRLQAIRQAQFKELAITSPEDKPNEIAVVVEEAAELNIPIENMYELRHEQKDDNEDKTTTDTVVDVPEDTSQPSFDSQMQTSISGQPDPQQDDSNWQTEVTQFRLKPLYKQAILAGFWAAIFIVVLLAVLVVFTD